ncbi:MAG: hypothetical protein ACRDGQ_10355, partial [Candidatus Limnocylindrales bacterium]
MIPRHHPEPTLRRAAIHAVERALAAAIASGALPALPEPVTVEVQRPAKPEHGDLATNLALKLARPLRRAPLAIAEALAAELNRESNDHSSAASTPIESASVAPPGFINLRLADASLDGVLAGILAEPDRWGRVA